MAQGKIKGPVKLGRGRIPSRALFENGTYKIEEFHDVFIELEDMTEYKPALQLCGSWREWQRLKNDWKIFNNYIAEWKEELEVKLRSESVEKIIKLAKGDDPKALQAAKFISEGGWDKRVGTAGRPSNAEKTRAAKELAQAVSETKEEEKRMLSVINGGK
jgi:hypothetical protein